LLTSLLVMSCALSVIVGEGVSILTGYMGAPIVKPLIAAFVIWGLGEGALYVLDRNRFGG